MDFRDTPDEAEFRASLRQWLADALPAGWADRTPAPGRWDEAFTREWTRKLYDAGYVGLTWPKEYGGGGAPHTYQGIYLEETARVGAPDHIGVIGLGMAGPTIIAWGSDEQKKRYLPPLLAGEEVWCQGFSEPGSGSDLAGARTRAELDGDEWVVNGQKVWSSYAHIADWCILVVRTDPDAEKHRGLSYLLVDMHAPGVEVRPLRQITGDPEFNEVFFSDVRVPRDSMLGQPGEGWNVAMTTLLHERGTLGFALTAALERQVWNLVKLAKQLGADDPVVRDQIAQQWIDLQALRFTNYRSLTALQKTGVPGPEGSVAKLHWSEANQRLTKLALSLEGLASQLDGDGAVWDGFWQYQQLRSRGNTIEAGTSEVLRNIIAERVVGLPRSR
jgi:alkylation response protein AidB-like acyl-CoA dehydrogenase